jgi:MoaA/NifB/PqqE/SkfB family radical SAM enzyme
MINTGFSEITEDRVKYAGSGFWYCEIVLTGRCNFSCNYCNRFGSEIDIDLVYDFIERYKDDLRHVQLTGGEPTLSKHLSPLCKFIKDRNIKLGLSTNGSNEIEFYESLNVDKFSISLDDYDIDTLEERGYKKVGRVLRNIELLSKKYYVNVGLFVDKLNHDRIDDIIKFILSFGVKDVKISTSLKDDITPKFDNSNYTQYPILNYRVQRFREGKTMRGLNEEDNFKCELSLSDISVVGRSHYPCLVYAREGGTAIGDMSGDVKADRLLWYTKHEPKKDPICKKWCMDFKCDFNREVERNKLCHQI